MRFGAEQSRQEQGRVQAQGRDAVPQEHAMTVRCQLPREVRLGLERSVPVGPGSVAVLECAASAAEMERDSCPDCASRNVQRQGVQRLRAKRAIAPMLKPNPTATTIPRLPLLPPFGTGDSAGYRRNPSPRSSQT